MPREAALPPGTLALLVLRVLGSSRLHGYAIAQRIHLLSDGHLTIEEGSLYPLLQRLLLNGWVKAAWTRSNTGRQVREYRLTQEGRRQLGDALASHQRVHQAIDMVLDKA